MAYDKFSTQKVFQNELVNIYCNKILDRVHNDFENAEAKLVANDELARMIQGKVLSELPVVSFITGDTAIYDFLVKNIGEIISINTQLSFQNRIQVVTSYAYFEIWYQEAAFSTASVNGIYIRDFAEGNNNPVSPYNIVLEDPQEFTASATNDLYFQGWKHNLADVVKIKYIVGTAMPGDIVANISIEDVFATLPPNIYDEYRVSCQIVWNINNESQFNDGKVTLAGDIVGPFPGFLLTPENLEQQLTISFANLNLLSPGMVNFSLALAVNGQRIDSGLRDIMLTVLNIPFELEVLAVNEILAIPGDLHVPHIQGEPPLPGQEFEIVTGIDFTISIPNYFELSGGNIVPAATPSITHRRYSGTGRQTLTITVTQDFDLYEGSTFTSFMELRTADEANYGGRFRNIFSGTVTGYLFDAHGFVVDPEALEFFSIKGIENATAQEVQVVSTLDFTVDHPFWLQVSPLAGETFQKLRVEPINSDNLQPGDYSGVITLTSAQAFAEVPVNLKVVESIDEGLFFNALNFTHQNLQVSTLYSANQNERASVALEIKAYDYQGFPTSSDHQFKVTFFNNRGKIHLGEIVARRFKKLYSPASIGFSHLDIIEAPQLFRIFPYYKPAGVDVSLNIENRGTGVVTKNKEFRNVQYVRGRKPKQFSNDFGILNYEAVPVRVTPKTQAVFNFVRRFLDHPIKIYHNANLYKTITHSPGNNSLFGLAMFFKDFNPGDVIGVRLYKNDDDYFEQKYYVFPSQDQSHHLAFITEHNVLETFECTGALNFNSDFENITFTSYKDLVEHLENLESKSKQMLVINTGWVLKTNQVIIDSIIRSNKVWFIHQGKEISLTPVSKKMVNEDSEQELYEYTLEFHINRENDLQVYTS